MDYILGEQFTKPCSGSLLSYILGIKLTGSYRVIKDEDFECLRDKTYSLIDENYRLKEKIEKLEQEKEDYAELADEYATMLWERL